MLKMCRIAEEHKINVMYLDFEYPLNGIYIHRKGKQPGIGLSSHIRGNTPLLRCVMAEELGHHFTTVGDCIPKKFFSYADRLAVDKFEYKALKWAALYLIPLTKLVQAVKQGYREIWELADYFNITENMFRFRLELPDIQNLIYNGQEGEIFE